MLWRGAWSGLQSRCVDPRDVFSLCTLHSHWLQIRYHSTDDSLRHLCAAVEVPFTGRQQAARGLARKLLLGKGTAGNVRNRHHNTGINPVQRAASRGRRRERNHEDL